MSNCRPPYEYPYHSSVYGPSFSTYVGGSPPCYSQPFQSVGHAPYQSTYLAPAGATPYARPYQPPPASCYDSINSRAAAPQFFPAPPIRVEPNPDVQNIQQYIMNTEIRAVIPTGGISCAELLYKFEDRLRIGGEPVKTLFLLSLIRYCSMRHGKIYRKDVVGSDPEREWVYAFAKELFGVDD